MKAFAEFLNKSRFSIVLVGFLFVLSYLGYRWFFGWDIRIPNPTFSTINNFDSIECQPLARGGSSVWNSMEQKYTGAWARDSTKELEKKWLTKWIAMRERKIYLGTYTGVREGSDYINFDEVFNLVDQKNETKLLGSRVNLVGGEIGGSLQNVKFTTLMLDKTKGILSVSVNESSWYGDESVGGYNEVYTCREVASDTLSGSKGLPEVDKNSQIKK